MDCHPCLLGSTDNASCYLIDPGIRGDQTVLANDKLKALPIHICSVLSLIGSVIIDISEVSIQAHTTARCPAS